MTIKPEALRLANEYYEDHWIVGTKTWCREAVEELRRLHEVNAELVEALQRCAGSLNPDHPNTAFVFAAIAKATGEQYENQSA